jgi:hypothetical protein
MTLQSVVLLLVLSVVSCASPYLKRSYKSGDLIVGLTKSDTLIVSNCLVYSYVTRSAPYYPVTEQLINKDSVMDKLITSFSNNDILFRDETFTGINYRDSMKMRRIVSFKNLDEDLIMMSNVKLGYQLFPVITFTNVVHFGGYMTANAITGNGGFKHYTYFNLILYIFREGRFVHKSQMRYLSDRYFVNSFEEGYKLPSGVSIKQEHWDELVRRTMRGYFKQVGKNRGE